MQLYKYHVRHDFSILHISLLLGLDCYCFVFVFISNRYYWKKCFIVFTQQRYVLRTKFYILRSLHVNWYVICVMPCVHMVTFTLLFFPQQWNCVLVSVIKQSNKEWKITNLYYYFHQNLHIFSYTCTDLWHNIDVSNQYNIQIHLISQIICKSGHICYDNNCSFVLQSELFQTICTFLARLF